MYFFHSQMHISPQHIPLPILTAPKSPILPTCPGVKEGGSDQTRRRKKISLCLCSLSGRKENGGEGGGGGKALVFDLPSLEETLLEAFCPPDSPAARPTPKTAATNMVFPKKKIEQRKKVIHLSKQYKNSIFYLCLEFVAIFLCKTVWPPEVSGTRGQSVASSSSPSLRKQTKNPEWRRGGGESEVRLLPLHLTKVPTHCGKKQAKEEEEGRGEKRWDRSRIRRFLRK